MDVRQATLETCHLATGTVVAIDVIRAFTTAAFAFAAGARDIVVTGTVEEALQLRRTFAGVLAMGEVDGLPIDGFDYGNSPAALIGADLAGRRVIQRTSAGTQGVVMSTQASALVASSFVCASATVRYLRQVASVEITLLPTGIGPGRDGDEDAACADYVTALLESTGSVDSAPYVRRVHESRAGRLAAGQGATAFHASDLACCVAVDRFDFAMPVSREAGLLIMRPVVV